MQVHRVLLAHQRVPVHPPAVIFTLAPEVRGNAALADYLFALGVAGLIDDAPRPEVAGLVQSVLVRRYEQASAGNPAVG